MYATMTKVKAHYNTCGTDERLDELICSAIIGQHVNTWEDEHANISIDCLGVEHMFAEYEVTEEEVQSVINSLQQGV